MQPCFCVGLLDGKVTSSAKILLSSGLATTSPQIVLHRLNPFLAENCSVRQIVMVTRKANGECRTVRVRRGYFDGAAVRNHDLTCYIQSQTDASWSVRCGLSLFDPLINGSKILRSSSAGIVDPELCIFTVTEASSAATSSSTLALSGLCCIALPSKFEIACRSRSESQVPRRSPLDCMTIRRSGCAVENSLNNCLQSKSRSIGTGFTGIPAPRRVRV